MHILLVFAMVLGVAHVQTEVMPSLTECRKAGRDLVEVLKDHKHVKDAQWQCIEAKAGKPT